MKRAGFLRYDTFILNVWLTYGLLSVSSSALVQGSLNFGVEISAFVLVIYTNLNLNTGFLTFWATLAKEIAIGFQTYFILYLDFAYIYYIISASGKGKKGEKVEVFPLYMF